MQPKPIKRSEQLAPLSRDHHEGLLFAWKIKQGLKYGAPVTTISRFVDWFWEAHLKEHFREEEQYLAPSMPPADAMIHRMLEEHQNIEALVHINAAIGDEANLEQLAEAVTNHIRFEERELFPYIEKTASVDALETISKNLTAEVHQPQKWADEFWVKK